MSEEFIYLPENVNSLWLYNELLSQLNKYYQAHKREDLVKISFDNVKWLDPLSIPNIMIIGTILKSFHKQPIPITFPYDLRLVNFLRSSKFFVISDLPFLQLFDYSEDLVNQAGFFINKEYRDKHKIHYYKPELKYYEILTEEEQQTCRSQMYETIRYGIVPSDYRDILQDQKVLNNYEVDTLLDIFSEIICNSILYSKSISYSFLQTGKYNSSIAISDAGIGFKKSLENKKNFKYPIFAKYREELDVKIFEDFLIIIEVLYYSMKQNRRNLWSLKEIIVNCGGTLRIHYNSTQVVFSSSRCAGCDKTAEECIQCFLDRFYTDQKVSALRIFPVKLRGVHIEIEIGNGGYIKSC
jgi:hypothetical protein